MNLTRLVYPLSLQQRINYKLYKLFPNKSARNVKLTFCPHVKMDLFATDWGHKSIIFNGFYELDLTRRILNLAYDGGLMVDVGANYGYFSCLWAGTQPGNTVIAFEAGQRNIAPLINNISKNNFTDRIKVQTEAVGRQVGTCRFSPGGSEQQTSWGSIVSDDRLFDPEIPMTSLDHYFTTDKHTIIKVLKIDTEGADTWVLFGAEQLLREQRIKHLFFEHNVGRMQTLGIEIDEAANFLKAVGYTVQQISTNEFYAHPNHEPKTRSSNFLSRF